MTPAKETESNLTQRRRQMQPGKQREEQESLSGRLANED
jgi:hypothetical protein